MKAAERHPAYTHIILLYLRSGRINILGLELPPRSLLFPEAEWPAPLKPTGVQGSVTEPTLETF